MSDVGRVIESPILKDRITFLKTTEETQGEYLLFQVELSPGGGVLMHYHTTFTERFEVSEGELTVDLGGKRLRLEAGQSAVASPYAVHRFSNESAGRVTFLAEVRPARQFEKNLRITYGLARDGKTNEKGIPKNLLHLAVSFQLADTYLPGFPAWMQRIPFAPLAIIARLAGVDRALARYLVITQIGI